MGGEGRGRAAAVAAFYFTCSISMNFLNKAVVSSYEFNYPFFIMSCQMVVTVVVLDLLRLLRLAKLPAYSLRDGAAFLSCSLAFTLHSTLSLIALHGMNIPMYGAIKRCTPLVNLALSVVVLKKAMPSSLLTSSVGIIAAGALVASLGDLQFDLHAYTMGGLSVMAQAAYLTLVQRTSELHHRSTLEMLHVNGFNTLPIFLTVSMVTGEPARVGSSLAAAAPGFLPVFGLLIVSGCVLTWSQFLCAAVCSALTTSMVSVAKSVIQTVLGFFTFGGVRFHPLNVVGAYTSTHRTIKILRNYQISRTKETGLCQAYHACLFYIESFLTRFIYILKTTEQIIKTIFKNSFFRKRDPSSTPYL